jgi:hypothetical protein
MTDRRDMYCNHCKKEEETITIAGKTYCANCSTVLAEKKAEEKDLPKHKIPKIEPTENEIRTEEVKNPPKEESKEIRKFSRETNIPDVGKDELGGSAILLDILSDNAKETTDKETMKKDEELEKASEEVLDLLSRKETKPKEKYAPNLNNNKVMNDVAIKKRKDYQSKKHQNIIKAAEEEIKDEAEKIEKVVISESGYTKEYDLMIMSIALTALALVLFAIFITFR